MRIIVHGQQAFGKSVLEALVGRGEDIVGVYCAPDREGRPVDPIKQYAAEHGLPVFQPRSYRTPEIAEQMASLRSDLCVMAFVTAFVPERVLNTPTHGSIQYHPSLLPRHRGGSSINWPIIWGEATTGLSIFWPNDGLDEGPILMQKEVEITADDTLGSLYFDKLFPLGVEAMLESVDLVREGKAPKIEQDHTKATYEGWCRGDLVRINWHMPTGTTWNLIRGCNPAPGAWTTFEGVKVAVFDSARIEEARSVQPGEITRIGDYGMQVATADGQLLVKRVRPAGGKKVPAGEWAREAGVGEGARLT